MANSDDVTFGCVAGGSPEACMDAIRNGTAQLTTLDGKRGGVPPRCCCSCMLAGYSQYAAPIQGVHGAAAAPRSALGRSC